MWTRILGLVGLALALACSSTPEARTALGDCYASGVPQQRDRSVTLERRQVLGPLGHVAYRLWWRISKLFAIRQLTLQRVASHSPAMNRSLRAIAIIAIAVSWLSGTSASATFANETTLGDYGNDFASRTLLPGGTDQVFGFVDLITPQEMDVDWFAWTDLQPGSAFSITFASFLGADFGGNYTLWDESENQLGTAAFVPGGSQTTVTGVVPASGQLATRVFTGPDSLNYQIDLDAARVPEPSTAPLVAASLAGLAARHRRES